MPASLLINLDTERCVASAQVWEHGYLDMECLEIATAATCDREHRDGLTEGSLKAALQQFAAVVLGRATLPEMSA